MLQKLSIHNYALIDSLDIEFDAGLNIITGETGAGKSIILGALSLILGQRAESKYFFNQEKKCIIEGIFIFHDEQLKPTFESLDLDFFKETTLRREISIDGKSRGFINDTPVNLNTLKQIGEQLIAIHSQHATLEINDPAFQLLVVDVLANHQTLLKEYRTGFKTLKKNTQLLHELTDKANEARSKQDYEQFLFNELEQAKLLENEQEELEQELERLTHAENIKKGLLQTLGLINENDVAAINLLKEANTQLSTIERYDTAIGDLNERLKSTLIELKDIAGEIEQLEQQTEHSAEKLEATQERLNIIYTLQQKHRVSSNIALIAIKQELEENLSQLLSSDERLDKLQKEIELLQEDLNKKAALLSKNRKNTIKTVENTINATLKKLAMPNATLMVEQQNLTTLTADGIDSIKLLFTANAGQQPAPIAKVASGGELARLMLAIKALLAKHTALATLIFDEIDTGISGETALKVGSIIAELGHDMQIICITHLPQIAAKGNAHYFVYKNESDIKTTTGIRRLKAEERVEVIAEMLSGKNPGTSALQNARDLLSAN